MLPRSLFSRSEPVPVLIDGKVVIEVQWGVANGVQIMTPAYVANAPQPAVVEKKSWFASPAVKAADSANPPDLKP